MANQSETAYSAEYLAESRTSDIIGGTTFMLIVVTIVFALRMYAQRIDMDAAKIQSILLPMSWICFVGMSINDFRLPVIIPFADFGHHIQTSTAEQEIFNEKILYATFFMWWISSSLSRLSIIFTYLRIFINRYARIIAKIIGTLITINFIAGIFTISVSCIPLRRLWDPDNNGGPCFHSVASYRAIGIINVALDTCILVLPMHTLWNLHAPLGRKIAVGTVFLTGSLGLIASCVRVGQFFNFTTEDDTWNDVPDYIWIVIEAGLYLTAACLLGLRPLLRSVIKCGGRLRSSKLGKGSHNVISSFHKRKMQDPTRDPKTIQNAARLDDYTSTSQLHYTQDASHDDIENQAPVLKSNIPSVRMVSVDSTQLKTA